MTVKLNYFKFILILHPITYLTLNPKAREFPLVANNHSDNKKAEGMWSRTWPDSECVLPTAVYILNIQRSSTELKPVYTSLQLLLVQVRSLPKTVNCSQSIFFAVPFCTFQAPAADGSAWLSHCHSPNGETSEKLNNIELTMKMMTGVMREFHYLCVVSNLALIIIDLWWCCIQVKCIILKKHGYTGRQTLFLSVFINKTDHFPSHVRGLPYSWVTSIQQSPLLCVCATNNTRTTWHSTPGKLLLLLLWHPKEH